MPPEKKTIPPATAKAIPAVVPAVATFNVANAVINAKAPKLVAAIPQNSRKETLLEWVGCDLGDKLLTAFSFLIGVDVPSVIV